MAEDFVPPADPEGVRSGRLSWSAPTAPGARRLVGDDLGARRGPQRAGHSPELLAGGGGPLAACGGPRRGTGRRSRRRLRLPGRTAVCHRRGRPYWPPLQASRAGPHPRTGYPV